MTPTKEEMQQLTDEFIHFQINQMTREEMASYVYNSMRQEIICQRTHLPLNESLKLQIDEYDEKLYDIDDMFYDYQFVDIKEESELIDPEPEVF